MQDGEHKRRRRIAKKIKRKIGRKIMTVSYFPCPDGFEKKNESLLCECLRRRPARYFSGGRREVEGFREGFLSTE